MIINLLTSTPLLRVPRTIAYASYLLKSIVVPAKKVVIIVIALM